MKLVRGGAWRRIVALIGAVAAAGIGVAATTLSASAAASHVKNVNVTRCGILNAPKHPKEFYPEHLGIYIVEGHVSCAKGRSLINMAFTVAGKDTGAGDTERYPDRWECGGQMGYYGCEYPASQTGHFTASVQARDCDLRGVGCPAHISTELPSVVPAAPAGLTTATVAQAANETPVLGIKSAFIGGSGFGRVKPRTVGFGGDATTYYRSVAWSSWGAGTADGAGRGSCLLAGEPPADARSCPVQLFASRLGACQGRRAYTRLSVYADESASKRVRYANRVNVCTHHE